MQEEKLKTRDDYRFDSWDYALETPITIDGKRHTIKMYQGMSGIGSRTYWIDGKQRPEECVTQSNDLTQGNHFIYRINWRENPWDTVDLIISEDELEFLLDKKKQPSWRNPMKLNI